MTGVKKLIKRLHGECGQVIFTEFFSMVAFVVILLFSIDLGLLTHGGHAEVS